MSMHGAEVRWTAQGDFIANKYSRAHRWHFDGGAVIAASASPDIVPVPLSDPAGVDPEESFVAAIAACHMLWFLDLARRDGLDLASYRDAAVGHMAKNAQGGLWIARVDLYPQVTYAGRSPSAEQTARLHHKAHDACFIANSVKTEIVTHLE